MPRRVTKKEANHVVGLVSGVTVKDNKFEAAEKVIATMRLAGMNTTKAERMLAAARAREAGR